MLSSEAPLIVTPFFMSSISSQQANNSESSASSGFVKSSLSLVASYSGIQNSLGSSLATSGRSLTGCLPFPLILASTGSMATPAWRAKVSVSMRLSWMYFSKLGWKKSNSEAHGSSAFKGGQILVYEDPHDIYKAFKGLLAIVGGSLDTPSL